MWVEVGRCSWEVLQLPYGTTQVRAAVKRQQASKYGAKVTARAKRKQHVQENPLPRDELGDVFR